MEASVNSPLVVKFIDFNSALVPETEHPSVSLKSPNDEFSLSLGQSREIHTTSLDISLILQDKILCSTSNVELTGHFDEWVHIDGLSSIRLTATSKQGKKKPILSGISSMEHLKCTYLKRINTIDLSEKEMQQKLCQLKYQIPENYLSVLETSPQHSPPSSSRSKTNQSSLPTSELPLDYECPGFFGVDLENISANEPDLLQNVAIGLLVQVHQLRMQVKEYQMYQETIVDYDFFMKSLGDSLIETREQCVIENENAEKKMREIEHEIGPIEEEAEGSLRRVQEIAEEIGRVRSECEGIKKDNAMCGNSEKNFKETIELRRVFEENLDGVKKLEQQLVESDEKFKSTYPEQELALVVNEKILGLAELQRRINKRDMALQEGVAIRAELAYTEGLLDIEGDLFIQHTGYVSENKDYAKTNQLNHGIFSEFSEEKTSLLSISKDLSASYSKTIDNLSQTITAKDQYLKTLSLSQQKPQESLDKTIEISSSLKHRTKTPPPRSEYHSDFSKKYYLNCGITSKLFQELEYISDTLIIHAETSLTSLRCYRQVLSKIEAQDLQQESMHKLIGMIKQSTPAYVPVKNDSTDVALAKYLNDKHNNLEVPFRRIDKQVYNFGSIKVELKIDGEFMVCIGGNAMDIEEFIRVYTPIEKTKVFSRSNSIKKIERKNTGNKNGSVSLEQILKSMA